MLSELSRHSFGTAEAHNATCPIRPVVSVCSAMRFGASVHYSGVALF